MVSRLACGVCILAIVSVHSPAGAQLRLTDDGTRIVVLDNDRPILAYEYESDEGPANFLHPIYGLSGELLTAPSRNPNGHSGIFWAWKNCHVGGRLLNIWDGVTAERAFERWLVQSVTPERVMIGLQNVWMFRDTGEAQLLETVYITVWPEERSTRAVDVEITLRNISFEKMEFGGFRGDNGFCLRLADDLKELTLSGGQGAVKQGVREFMSPWIDLSYRDARHSTYSGLAVLQHPSNPGFSSKNWFLGNDGIIGVGLTPSDRKALGPGEALKFRYRLFMHRGYGPNQGLEKVYAAYTREILEPGRR